MRGFMGRPCDLYFTIERKLRRFLSCCMRLYCVPEEKQEQLALRREYIDSVVGNLARELDNTYVVDEHGNKRKLRRKGEK